MSPDFASRQPHHFLAALLLSVAVWSQLSGAVVRDPNFQPRFEIAGVATKLVSQPDGKILVGGTFNRAGQMPGNGLLRLTAHGQVDPSFTPSITGNVYAVAVQPADGKILVAGEFPGRATTLVRLNPDGGLDASFLTNVWAEYQIKDLVACPDGKILVGGQFGYLQTEAGTVRTRGIARLFPNGEPDFDFYPMAGYGPDNSQSVNSLALLPDGRIYVGGQFASFNQRGSPNLVRLRPDGTLDRTFETYEGPNGPVKQLLGRPGGGIWIAGDFSLVNRIARAGVALLADDGSVDPRFRPELETGPGCTALLPFPDGGLLVGRQIFSWTGGAARRLLVRLDATGRVLGTLETGVKSSGNVPSIDALLATGSGNVLLGGHFDMVGDQTRIALGEIQPDGRLTDRFSTQLWASGQARKLEIQTDGKCLVAGAFSAVNGITRPTLARLNQDGSTDPSFQPVLSGSVWAMALQADQKLVIGGFLVRPGGEEVAALARLNPDGTTDFFRETGSLVRAIEIDARGRILLGGQRAGPGSLFNAGVVRLLADGSLDNEFHPKPAGYDSVFAITQQAGGKLVIGGNFTDAASSNYLARLNEDGSEDSAFRPTTALNSIVTSLAVDSQDRILVGGWFGQWGGTDQSGLGRLLPDGTLDRGFRPALGRFSQVERIVVQTGGRILVAGRIIPTVERPLSGIARLNTDGTEDKDFFVAGTAGTVVAGTDLAVEAGGQVLLARWFSGPTGNDSSLVRLGSGPLIVPRLGVPSFTADGQIRFTVTLPDRNPRQLVIETSDDLQRWDRFHSFGSNGEPVAQVVAATPAAARKFFRMMIVE